ncbi:phage tail protein [Burkholderia multivorans]|uniref:phage tail protein n=1 Tax=Burkholderia multivorans TaxID=87883 RepID=UPI00158D0C57|nr:phage tail protein [Burkholderia multivorans]MBR8451757.1 phage tail protein [Burkholderia multivorans]MBU9447740.1 phage tail protein [Burkholderia multivorans]MCL4645574.1 phage tail protein [Burkholderia multivorans]UQN87316.1 phage tail protein [Burkholderia multivorans]UQO72504.1 phage tail protein [Burkholderia multivorans]
MDFISSVTQAATQASIASERVRHVVRVFDRNRSASQNTVDTLTKLATGNLTSAADLLRGATSLLSVAGDLSPQIGTVMRSFSATGAAVNSVLKMVGGVNHPLIQSAAQSVMGALGDAKTQFTALVGEQTMGALQSFAQTTGLSSVLSGLFDSATSSTPHLLTLSTDDGDAFHFGLSTAAYDKLRRSTRFKIASQERLNREEAQQPVSQGGDTITLSGVVFPSLGAGFRQLEALRAIGAKLKPVQLTAGTGDVLGRWYLHSVDEEQEALMSDGAPRKQTYSLEFGRYGEDFANL